MAKSPPLYFRISTGLKDLLGQDLITDEFIAVFELVKNSYDAQSKEVFIVFENLATPNAKIKIIDKGKGMAHDDLIDKWLFVAYSAKRDGTEDSKTKDYRDNLKPKRFYAGAKGVGRFSCDRIGAKLKLYSIQESKNSVVEHIEVNWKDFEIDSKILFKDIPIKHEKLSKLPLEFDKYNLSHGTILEISLLRDNWDREKILELKTSLAKLILPKIDGSSTNDSFKINVESNDEIENDKKYKQECKKNNLPIDAKSIVNGSVENFIFETLNLKTTQISSNISEDGKTTTTKLTDRGEFIYEIGEENEFKLLNNISIQIYFLTRAAKWNFTNQMNTEPVNYGNLFMYKNGFRIHPYGNPRDDSYGIDARRSQGHSRYLGTRDIVGKIEIRGKNHLLRETTSRDGGLIKNSSFEQLLEYLKKILVRLEKYVVEAKEWGVDDEELKDLKNGNSGEAITRLLSNLSNDKSVKSITYNDKIADLLKIHEENSARKLLKNFQRIAHESNDSNLKKKASLLEQKINSLQKAKNEAEKQVEDDKKTHKKKEETLKKTNLYLLSVSKDLSPEALGLVHHIGHKLSQTTPQLDSLIKKISNDKFEKEAVLKKLTEIKLNIDQVDKISRLVIRSNFNLMVSEEQADLISYVEEYVDLYKEINEFSSVEIEIEKNISEFKFLFSKINLAIILDNLISNSKRAKATKAKIIINSGAKNSLQLIFSDNGKGVDGKMKESMFDLGITSTVGAGVGLFINKKLMSEMGGHFNFIGNNIYLKGAAFELIF